jgi:hypothetical protein
MNDQLDARASKPTTTWGLITFQLDEEKEILLSFSSYFHQLPDGGGLLSARNDLDASDQIVMHLTYPKNLELNIEHTLQFDQAFKGLPHPWLFFRSKSTFIAGVGSMKIMVQNEGNRVRGSYRFQTEKKIHNVTGVFDFQRE